MKKIYAAIFVISLFLAACSGSPDVDIPEEIASLENLSVVEADAGPSRSVGLNETASYGDTEDVIIGQMGMFAVDESGRVFLADISQQVIHVFAPDGEWLTQIGGEGEGPGEFRGIGPVKVGNGLLHAVDQNLRRITRYELESLEFHSAVSLNSDDPPVEYSFPYDYHVRPDGTYLVFFTGPFTDEASTEEMVWQSALLDSEGKYASDIYLEVRANEWIVDSSDDFIRAFPPPYGRKSLMSMTPDGVLYHAWSEQILVKSYNNGGEYIGAVYFPYQSVPLNRSDALESYSDWDDRIQTVLRNQNMPDTWQAFDIMHVDEQKRIWIAAVTEDRDLYEWIVFSEKGELLGVFNWPRTRQIQAVKNESVYTRETDEETGLTEVVRYDVGFD
ncbi:6-bladed beta-propeller [Rhodohalobacter halophilus]|uniref:6-bladed beta-propeller n=1 Tax=Rhodohalobacter halophilus TaxID=1812810 RepID=UPI00083F5B84|nr:6-bladed beta-propeller [Rhodohalobacter halophilus]